MSYVDSSLLTPAVIREEFERQIKRRIGGVPVVECEMKQVPDTFGPALVLEARWDGFTAHLNPGRVSLALALKDYSRCFVQPVIEAWLLERCERERRGLTFNSRTS